MRTMEQQSADAVHEDVILTLEQQFALAVHANVTRMLSKSEPDRKKYGSMAHKLPVLVRTAGLVQALAFVHSRGKGPQQQLLEDLARVVIGAGAEELLAQSRTADLRQYMYLTDRALLALKWYKRFAQSILEVEAGDQGA